jgi:dTDP-4-dehydrorhamnose reductase
LRILILGGGGMLGHRLLAELAPRHEVKVTLRQDIAAYDAHGLFKPSNTYDDVEVHSTDRLLEVVAEFRPHVIVNAIGIVKQRAIASESIPSLEINALLPHRLALVAASARARLIHFSTDCVFSGRGGNYSESDRPDPEDLYGHTKLLGEVSAPHCVTLRTSLIGHELMRKKSLVDWFLAQRGTIRGFTRAVFSGFTTIEMSRIVEMIVTKHPDLHGVWHVGSEPIDKHTLLNLVKKHYGVETEIVPDDAFCCDRSLDSSRFRERVGYRPPSWEAMVEEMSRTGRAQR